ncbi:MULTISPECIES: alpha/beta fold hydrolase [unclassified Sulfitobacter]|uniref:alpha/beta fold hydrolase n=1 Tax=unclassified Sulfitobacter TaxID=196795 RepID=UPI0007C2F2F8|nr:MULTISPECIES: alpha/beta hydrolase [unclassified Sulfitobacter]KZX96886.1 alpha/beta hydrolase [Sulfitobacter sp. HI0023]KZY24078.1 alpha/beta hydrolase [Sulfitobacter sp. HI0040]KZZ68760.1 alpha/beta hydrolase [Sulfitobacter sp. HI0129]
MNWTAATSEGIEYLERPGAGAVMVLLHGIGSNAASFTPLLAHLPENLRVIAWNAPGYGGSAPLARDWPQAQDYAAALSDFLDRLGIECCAMLGHSLGALMAASFAAGAANRVSHLTLAAPAIGHGVPPGEALSAPAQARIEALERLGAPAFAAERAARLLHLPEREPEALALVEGAMAQVSMPGYGQAARMLASGRLLDDAERLWVPTDVIVGAEDRITPPEGARRLHGVLRGRARGRFTELPGLGHALYQQRPARFAETLSTTAAAAA